MPYSFKHFHDQSLFEEYLLESQNYEDMFRPFMQDEVYRPAVSTWIKKVKPALKKSDRIVWFLKNLRLLLIAFKFGKDEFERELKKPKAISLNASTKRNWLDASDKFQTETKQTTHELLDYVDKLYFDDYLNDLIHLYSLGIKEIDEYNLGVEDIWSAGTKLQDIEREYNAQFSKMVPDTNEKDWTNLISFPDGFAWYNLNVSYCPEEGKAMGHCGNQAAGPSRPYERVLSLRKKVKHAGKTYYDPHLTFILNTKTHSLGEMKGKGNSKPTEKYHKYIVPLLKKKDLIQRIVGGGYKPENNFSFGDLDDKEQEEALKINPGLAKSSFLDMVRDEYRPGQPPPHNVLLAGYRELQDLVEDGFNVELPNEEPTTENIVHLVDDINLKTSFNDFADFLTIFGTRNAEHEWKWIEEGNFSSLASISEETSNEFVSYIFEEEDKISKKIEHLLKIKYEDADIDSLIEDGIENEDWNGLVEVMSKELPEIWSLLERSLYYVTEDYMRTEALDQVRTSLYDLSEYFILRTDGGKSQLEDYVYYSDSSADLEFDGPRGFVKFMKKMLEEEGAGEVTDISEVVRPVDINVRLDEPYFDNESYRSAFENVKEEFDSAYKADKKAIEDSLPVKQLSLFPEQ